MTTTNDKDHLRDQLAHEFTRILKDWAADKPGAWATLVKANAAETNDGICHSHDYCDANQAMIYAFEKVHGREPVANEDADIATITAAWDEAKRIWQVEGGSDPRAIRVFVTGDGPNWKGTLAEFFEINADGIGPEDRAEITATVLAGNIYNGGGGAAGEFTISKYDPPEPNPKPEPELRPGKVQMDGVEGEFECSISNDEYWNGFSCPWFTPTQALVVLTALWKAKVIKDEWQINTDAKKVTTAMHPDTGGDSDEEDWVGQEFVGLGVLYPIGNGAWCWSEVYPDWNADGTVQAERFADIMVRYLRKKHGIVATFELAPPHIRIPLKNGAHLVAGTMNGLWECDLVIIDGAGAEEEAAVTGIARDSDPYDVAHWLARGHGLAMGRLSAPKAKRLVMVFTTHCARVMLGRDLDRIRANGDPATLERYYDEAGTAEIVCSTDEREEFEREQTCRGLDGDTLAADEFAALGKWMLEGNTGLRVESFDTKEGSTS